MESRLSLIRMTKDIALLNGKTVSSRQHIKEQHIWRSFIYRHIWILSKRSLLQLSVLLSQKRVTYDTETPWHLWIFQGQSPASILSRLECAYCRLKIVYIVDWKMCLLSTQKCAYCCLKSVHIVRLIRKSLPATCSSPYKAKPGSWGTPRFKILACYCQWTTQTSLFSADKTLSFIWYSYLSLKILLKCKVNTFTS